MVRKQKLNKMVRLNSQTLPINALNPSLLATGQKLYDVFQSGQTVLDGVPIPYPGWVEQMTACAPTVAQALTPYAQYCSPLRGANENLGSSTYPSFQLKAENRFSHGLWFLGAYAASKLLTSADSVQTDATRPAPAVRQPGSASCDCDVAETERP